MLAKLDMPFFRVPGNHDIANKVAQEVWRERHGATYYHFVYKNVLFVVLDSEDPPRVAPEGIKEKIEQKVPQLSENDRKKLNELNQKVQTFLKSSKIRYWIKDKKVDKVSKELKKFLN